MAQIQFSLIKKIKIGRPEHSLTHHPLRPITSNFSLTPLSPLKVDVMCVSSLSIVAYVGLNNIESVRQQNWIDKATELQIK